MTLRTLNYGNYGIFLIMGSAGFCPSAVGLTRVGLNERSAGSNQGSGLGRFPCGFHLEFL